MITLSAYAKINLTLEVLGVRPDGFHEVRSILQTISLVDTLSLELDQGINLRCNFPELASPHNLALEAAELIKESTACPKGVLIHLTKGIPQAAGLGGGASDAAATLQGLNQLWGLGLDRERLQELAARLGSDVPFFLYGGTALAEGWGGRITPLPPLPRTWALLLRPPLPTPPEKTRRLYSHLRPTHFTRGQFTGDFTSRLKKGKIPEPGLLFNAFEEVALQLFPGLDRYQERLLSAGAGAVHLAGSGPTLFTLTQDRTWGEGVCRLLREEGLEAYLAPTVERNLYELPGP